jgi:dihydrolipoamide dehydrogenase
MKHFVDHGIDIPGEVKINFKKMIERKASVVDQTTKGIDFLMNKTKLMFLPEWGLSKMPHTLK